MEAALYISGRPLDLEELCKISKVRDPERVKEMLQALKRDYKRRDSSLEVVALSDDRYVLQLRPKYVSRVERLSPGGYLGVGALKTLSFIAMRQPVKQSEVIRSRGTHTYKYIQELIRKRFVEAQPHGRSQILQTTEHFASYFGLPNEPKSLKLQLHWQLRKRGFTEKTV